MNFRRRAPEHEPEIQLIPFIDVLLVLVIFLMLSTTWSRFTQIPLQLAVADAQAASKTQALVVTVSAQGDYTVNHEPVAFATLPGLIKVMGPQVRENTQLVIRADASAPHQSVVTVMEAARLQGLAHITFSTQATRPR